MQHATDSTSSTLVLVSGYDFSSAFFSQDFRYSQYKIICRNGFIVPFMPNKISSVMTRRLILTHGRGIKVRPTEHQKRALENHAI